MTPRLGWLRGRLEDSKILWVKLPIYLHNTRHGAKVLVIDPAKINRYLEMPADAVKKLTESFIYPKTKDSMTHRKKQNWEEVARLYQEMLASGQFKNRAALARHFGVSRAWVTTILNKHSSKKSTLDETY